MQYRVNCLPQAREHARRMNSAGARYPWMASYDGSEQCESWDIGASEVHVTADVVYALDLYARVTGDAAFARQAEEVYIETACFWRSRYTSAPDGTSFDLLFCKGPDEYCGITSNNLFTNVMVRHNLHLALAAARRMQRKDPDRFAALCLSEEELAGWQALEQGIQIPRDPVTGHLRADDSFQLLEPVDPATLKQGGRRQLPSGLFRPPAAVPGHQAGGYAAGDDAPAQRFHPAGKTGGLAGRGVRLCGSAFYGGRPGVGPHLPDGWQGLHFRFYWHGATYCADVCRDPAGGVQTSLVFCEE